MSRSTALETEDQLVFSRSDGRRRARSTKRSAAGCSICRAQWAHPASCRQTWRRLDPTARTAASQSTCSRSMTARNGRWFDLEMDKLDRWAEDRRASLKAELDELDEALKDGEESGARLAPTLAGEARAPARSARSWRRARRSWRAYDQASRDIDRQKDALLDDISQPTGTSTSSRSRSSPCGGGWYELTTRSTTDTARDQTRTARPALARHRRRQARRSCCGSFPEARTEGGKIDFDRLKLALGETVDVGKERYGMTWPGKADCFKTIQAPSLGTLRPVPGGERQLRHDREPDHRGRQPRGPQASPEVVPGQGQDDLHRPALQHRQRLHLPRQLRGEPADLPRVHRARSTPRARSSAPTPRPTAASTRSG